MDNFSLGSSIPGIIYFGPIFHVDNFSLGVSFTLGSFILGIMYTNLQFLPGVIYPRYHLPWVHLSLVSFTLDQFLPGYNLSLGPSILGIIYPGVIYPRYHLPWGHLSPVSFTLGQFSLWTLYPWGLFILGIIYPCSNLFMLLYIVEVISLWASFNVMHPGCFYPWCYLVFILTLSIPNS